MARCRRRYCSRHLYRIETAPEGEPMRAAGDWGWGEEGDGRLGIQHNSIWDARCPYVQCGLVGLWVLSKNRYKTIGCVEL